MSRLIRFLDRHFKAEKINGGVESRTYLYRWVLWRPKQRDGKDRGRALYLHRFVGDDWSKDLHDHPKRFVTIGLRGRYHEEWQKPGDIVIRRRTFQAPWIRTFGPNHRHRLTLDEGRRECWTLVYTGPIERQWGFWEKLPDNTTQWTPWRIYVNKHGATGGAQGAGS